MLELLDHKAGDSDKSFSGFKTIKISLLSYMLNIVFGIIGFLILSWYTADQMIEFQKKNMNSLSGKKNLKSHLSRTKTIRLK
jgi:hypothetical protein